MNIDVLINMVKLRMDEVSPFEDEEMVSSPLIESSLKEAANNIVMLFPINLFDNTPQVNVTPVAHQDGSGYFSVPTDMLRFVRLKMNGWERPVTTLIPTHDPLYKLQYDPILRGGAARPVAFLTVTKNGRVIEYFSVPSGTTHTVTDFTYINKKSPEDIPDNLAVALTWEAAKLVYLSMQDANSATICQNNVAQQLNMFQQ